MSKISGCHIEEENLSVAWFKAFKELSQPGVEALAPMTVSITGFENAQPKEIPEVRRILDNHLKDNDLSSIHTVANTIFPNSLWNPAQGRQILFWRYHRILRNLKSVSANHNGLYFERMTEYMQGDETKNQLEHIITTYKGGNHRASALIAAIFNPLQDHTNQRQRGFPCLHEVTFALEGKNREELVVTAHYAVQYIYNKAYGNYLGICRLGRFMAQELEVKLTKVVFMVSSARLSDEITKADARELLTNLEPLVEAETASQVKPTLEMAS